MAPNVRMVYFPLHGRAELIRLCLVNADIKFEDEIITFEQWPERKAATPFGSLPVLYWDGEEVGQSLAIARFVAKKAGLAGENDVEQARADAIVDHVQGFTNKYYEIRYCQEEKRKPELIQSFIETLLPAFLKTSESLLTKRGGKFFSGNKLSYGDLAMFLILDVLNNVEEIKSAGMGDFQKEILAKLQGYPHLLTHMPMVQSQPKIAEYLKSRPEYPC